MLSYAEDALQTEPANRSIGGDKTRKTRRPLEEEDSRAEPKPVMDLTKVEDKAAGKELVVTQLPKKLWVASTAYNSRERVWHQVEGASWNTPIAAWTSACGKRT